MPFTRNFLQRWSSPLLSWRKLKSRVTWKFPNQFLLSKKLGALDFCEGKSLPFYSPDTDCIFARVSPSRVGSGNNTTSHLVSNISEESDPPHSSSYSEAQKNDVETEHRSRSFEQARTEPTTSHSTGMHLKIVGPAFWLYKYVLIPIFQQNLGCFIRVLMQLTNLVSVLPVLPL